MGKAAFKAEAALRGGVSKPFLSSDCWAEKRAYTGSAFPQYVNCSKQARRGFLTCHWHRHLESEAQELRALITKDTDNG